MVESPLLAALNTYINMYPRKYRIIVVADSRGRLLKGELQRLNDSSIYFNTRVRKGGKLIDLWEIVEEELAKGQADLLIIYGGVCNITDVCYDEAGTRSFWPPADIGNRFAEIRDLMKGLATNYNLLNSETKLCFMPEPGLSLGMVNHIHEPYSDELFNLQRNLEHELTVLHHHTKEVNDSMHCMTPWTLKATHLRRRNKWFPVYSRMRDGLHPTLHQAYKLACIIKEFGKKMLSLKRGGNN